jgi:hypothetical protein
MMVMVMMIMLLMMKPSGQGEVWLLVRIWLRATQQQAVDVATEPLGLWR